MRHAGIAPDVVGELAQALAKEVKDAFFAELERSNRKDTLRGESYAGRADG